MTPIPLGELRPWPSHHRSALWWLGLLYRRPRAFREALGEAGPRRAPGIGSILLLHALPWMLRRGGLRQFVLLRGSVVSEAGPAVAGCCSPLAMTHVGVATGIVVGIAVGIAGGDRWRDH